MRKVKFILFFLLSAIVTGQTKSRDTLTYKEFIYNVISEHPMAKIANLKQKIAKAKLLKAKGGFDPTLTSGIEQKYFYDKNYYNIFKNKITIPTPIGINITGGYDDNSGVFLNPENKTTNRGLWNAGVEIDVIQGLLTNQRRTDLKLAKIYQKIAKSQQQQMLNELIYKASKSYAEWQQYSSIYDRLLENLELSKMYLKNTKASLASGEKTAIDTLEANVYLQNNQIDIEKYKQLLAEKRIKLENYLWIKDAPVLLQTHVFPESKSITPKSDQIKLSENLDSIPKIALKLAKREQLILKQKLNREKLKPKLKLKYNQLLGTDKQNLDPIYNVDNYKWGASLQIPIFYRKERGKYRESKYKVEEIGYEIAQKKLEIQNKIAINQTNQKALVNQIILLEKNIKGYERLLQAETKKFEYGESSLFLINKRQEKLIESNLKLLSSENKMIVNYLDFMLLTNNIIPQE